MKIRNVALQAKVKSARHNGAHAALKVVLLTDFHRGVSCSARRHGRRQSRESFYQSVTAGLVVYTQGSIKY